MANDQMFGQNSIMTTQCPVCGVHAWIEAPTCPACGTALLASDPDDLFTTTAIDNAEVVHNSPPATRDGLWSTEQADNPANASTGRTQAPTAAEIDLFDSEISDAELVDDEPLASTSASNGGDDLWDAVDAEPGAHADRSATDEWFAGADTETLGAFSPEPVHRSDEVVDAAGDSLWDSVAGDSPSSAGATQPRSNGAFSSGTSTGASRAVPRAPSADRPLFVAPKSAATTRATQPVDSDSGGASGDSGLWDDSSPDGFSGSGVGSPDVSGADPNGLGAAVARLDADSVDRAAVPLSVCAVVLGPNEVVQMAVTGDMLGHPAAMVVTDRRIVVANGRRWRPVVDTFEFAAGLGVRGRHDGGVAAVTLFDDERLVTVDGIVEVAAAMQLAELIRVRTAT